MENESPKKKTSVKNTSKIKEEKPAVKKKSGSKNNSKSQEVKKPTVKRKQKTKNSLKTHETNLSSSEKRTLGLIIGTIAAVIGLSMMIYVGVEDESFDDNIGILIIGAIIGAVGFFIIWYTEYEWSGFSQEWLDEYDRRRKEVEEKRKKEKEEYEMWKLRRGL